MMPEVCLKRHMSCINIALIGQSLYSTLSFAFMVHSDSRALFSRLNTATLLAATTDRTPADHLKLVFPLCWVVAQIAWAMHAGDAELKKGRFEDQTNWQWALQTLLHGIEFLLKCHVKPGVFVAQVRCAYPRVLCTLVAITMPLSLHHVAALLTALVVAP